MSQLRIIRREAIGQFANAVYTYRAQLYKVWLISPWIGSYTDGFVDPLQLMIDALRSSPSCVLNVITRTPQKKAEYHRNAIKLLTDNVNPILFYCESLHTKLYVIEADGMTAAILGSPNLTPGGNTANIELALELRATSLTTTNPVSSTLRDLVQYAHDLLNEDSVKLVA